ncbi:O-methylsterigmatocystin oxidoreductase [Beauveria bassiana D1-5]|uniref:O-methylsterigmatocystin oxidoreductase n=1 Tax=Beauveria bassiana D1-5 TaxID=1245745 RepID=A0A0A2VRB8_BEABA|nr:O-methylsterigmatocystin oxidoreductase [Beauveria bassiana D1-5]
MSILASLDGLSLSPATLFLAAFIGLLLVDQLIFWGSGGYSLPPGPMRLPFIGNLLDLPPKGEPEFQHWLKHNERYGPISSVHIMGQTIIIIHGRDAAWYLLQKCSKSTSSRPHLEFAQSMCGYDNLLASQKYEDSSFRPRRRLVHQHLGTPAASERYKSLHQEQAGILIQRLRESPEKLGDHLKSFASAIVLEATYGYTLESVADPLVTLLHRMIDQIKEAFMPMAWVVDVLPALQHLPDWLPGMSFKKKAREHRQTMNEVADMPYAFVQEQMQKGTHRPSYVSSILETDTANSDDDQGSFDAGPPVRPTEESDIKYTAATMYGAGVETSTSTLEAFALAMVLFPDVQRKAQQEIDSVVGPDRLPSPQDRARLPYTSNLVTELLRWWPVLPMGVVHTAQEDIMYRDYLIPKDAILMPMVWWFCHDPGCYADPAKFDPDRFSKAGSNEPDPRGVVFGFARRICPGRFFADSSLFMAISHILATLTITNDVDDKGRPKVAEIRHTPSVASRPVEFPFKIVPRNAEHTVVSNAV